VSAPASKKDILRPLQATQSRKGKVKRYFTTFAGDAESKRDILRPSQATQSRRGKVRESFAQGASRLACLTRETLAEERREG
jgi:hypothetical protein